MIRENICPSIISAVGLLWCNKFEENPQRGSDQLVKIIKSYFNKSYFLQVLSSHEDMDSEEADESILNGRRLLSRYGVWLLVGLSTPNKETTHSTFGHMLSMLFQWFNATAYLPNDKTGTALEKLKSEYLPQWLRTVYDTHGEVFVNW